MRTTCTVPARNRSPHEIRKTATLTLSGKHEVTFPMPLTAVIATVLGCDGLYCSVTAWIDPADPRRVLVTTPMPVLNAFLTVIGQTYL